MQEEASRRTIGCHRVIRRLGHGGMGTVFEVRGSTSDKPVALKLLSRQLAGRRDLVEDFRQEFALLARLSHPALVQVFDLERTPRGDLFFTMELVRGRPLSEAAPAPEELPLVAQSLTEALAYVHRRGVVHGDLKPANVMREEDGRLRILDFGLSRALLALHPSPPRGTVEFLAPEVLRGSAPEGRSDLYSLGVTLYELLSGHPLFDGKNVGDLLLVKSDPRRHAQVVSSRISELPSPWRGILDSLLEPLPSARTPSPRHLLSRLEKDFDLPPTQPLLQRGETSTVARTELVGRERELSLLAEALDQLRESHGRALLLSGEEGVGKSRLLHEFRIRARVEGFPVLMVSLRERILPESLLPSSADRQEGATDFPSVLLLDDAEEATETQLDEIVDLGRASLHKGKPFLLVVASRTDASPVRKELSHFQDLRLSSLSVRELAEFATSLLYPRPVPSRLAERLHRLSGGNPLLVREILSSLITSRGDFDTERFFGRWLSDESLELPSVTRNLIEARLAPLSPETRRLLEGASIWGVSFLPARTRKLLRLKPAEFAERFSSAVESGLIGTMREGEEGELSFSHGITRQIVYQGIPSRTRHRLHRNAAAILEEESASSEGDASPVVMEAIARHWHLGKRKADAVRWALRNAAKWQGEGKNRAALAAYDRALDWSASFVKSELPAADLIHARLEKGLIHRILGEPREARTHLEAALDAARRGRILPLVARALHALGDLAFVEGSNDAAEENLEEARKVAARVDDGICLMRVLRSLGNVALTRADYHVAEEAYRDSLRLAEELDDRELVAGNLSNLGIVFSRMGDTAQAERHYSLSLEEAERLGLREQARRTLVSLGVLQEKTDRAREALRSFERSLAIAQEIGYRRGEAVVRYNIAEVYGRMGLLHKSLQEHDRSLAAAREVGDRTGEAMNLANRAEILRELGRLEEGIENAREALRLMEETGETHHQALAWGHLACLYLGVGERDRATEAARMSVMRAREAADAEEESRSLICQARVQRFAEEEEERERGLQLLAEADERAVRVGSSTLASWVKVEKSLLLLRQEDISQALELTSSLIAGLSANETRPLRLRILLARAQSLIRAAAAGELTSTSEAEVLASQALDSAQETGSPQGEVEARWLLSLCHQNEGRYREGAREAAVAARRVFSWADGFRRTEWKDGFLRQWEDLLRHAAALRLRQSGSHDEATRAAGFSLDEARRLLDDGSAPADSSLPVETATAPAPLPHRGSETLYEVSRIINTIRDLEELLPRILDLALQTTGAQRGLIILADPDSDALHVRARANVEEETVADATEISQTIMRDVIRGGNPVISADARQDPRYRDRQSVVDLGITSLLCVPLRMRDRLLGTVYVDRTGDPLPFSDEDLEFLTAFADLAAIAIENAQLQTRLAVENAHLRMEVKGRYHFAELLGDSPAWRRILRLLTKVVPTTSTVLLEGESGTGKELVARAIHYNGPRREGPFVAIDCGAIPAELLESELFGHARGAFTGATAEKRGLFEEAHGGTLFLDEVANIPLALQSKLLRVIQEREVRRVGETEARSVDVRILSASNRDLREEVAANRFREDLFYRLNVIPVKLPPLRERTEDILLLAHYWLERLTRDRGIAPKHLSPESKDLLTAYPWPGNVRELENALEQAAVMSSGEVIRPPDLPRELRQSLPDRPDTLLLRENERRLIAAALEKTDGEIKAAANLLGISRTTLYSKMAKHGIRKE